MTRPRTVVVVDDHPMFRDGLVALVDALEWAEVVGQAERADEAVAVVLEHRPDIVLMDLHLARGNGLEATARITAELPGTAALVLTMVENDDAVAAALRAGARGYLVKGASRAQIRRALEAVARARDAGLGGAAPGLGVRPPGA